MQLFTQFREQKDSKFLTDTREKEEDTVASVLLCVCRLARGAYFPPDARKWLAGLPDP